ncbi:MAG: ATP-binding cassette domain-containing protein [Dorea longicatena]
MKDYYIKTKDLSVGYQGKVLIRDINLDIKKGEIVTLIGPNGAGKSTILKSVTRQLKLIGGEVYLDSDEIRKLSYKSMARKVAVMLTERMKPELMTCHDVVATGRYPYTGRLGVLSGEDENKVDEALMAVHAQELGIRNFLEISDGQRQRILLARAICQEPEVMILDEPTSYLDIRHKLELLEILRKMAKEKEITVIMSLHEIDLAQKISDKVVCVKGDRIAGFGNPEEIFTEEKMRELYGIDNGYYDPCFGSVELPRVVGKPEVFVLSSGGTGIPVYRKLQKAGIPFAAGILYPGECDYQLARLLASEIISEEPYEPISCETYRKALEMMEQCKKVINAGVKTGKMNQKAGELLKIAEERGMLI